ncbi:transport integral membrane protein [Spirilliplanes yamanashiensis]|uniref:Transport integral membrane protein n=1 Tax=Spirilliplanes yamanashiensis TaxID=42233 RepID=A0A8J3YD71_9ACTN|nr:transport integral membrane protein [Spirilliplanes yamanashiensis]
MVAANPLQSAVLGYSPTAVTVTFSEPISLIPGRTLVLAPDGKRILDGDPVVEGTTLKIPIRVADRPLGTYVISYRVVSADSHPIAGGYTFSVGAPSATAPTAPSDDVHRSVEAAIPVAKYIGYLGLVLLIGPAMLLALLWPRRMSRTGPTRLVRVGALAVAVATLAGLWLQAPYSSGASAVNVSVTELRQVLASTYGVALSVRLAVLVALAVLLPPVLAGRTGRARGSAVVLLGIAGLATWPLSGHAGASPLPPISVLSAVVHIAAMSVWLGGLVTLIAFLLPKAHPRVLGVILPVWSRWATVAVVWLVGGGVVQALIEVRSAGQLVGTDYGRFLLAKTGLLAALLGAAAVAHRMVRRRTAVSADGPRLLRRTVGFEAATAAVVLAVSAMLVQTTPARSADVQAAAAAKWKGVAQTLTTDLFTLQYDIYPVQLGENNTVHAYIYTAAGKPIPAAEWKLTAAQPTAGIEPVTTLMLGLEPHHGTGAVTFPVPGEWEIKFTVRISDIDQATVATTVSVPAAAP